MRTTLPYLVLTAMVCVSGCGGQEADSAPEPDESAAVNAPETAQPAPATSTSNTTELSVDDIDRWQRGMQAELTAVQEAGAKLANAKDENEKLEALTAATEMGTIEAGASAAGVDPDRYRRLRNHFSGAVSQLSPIEMEMDVSQMPKEMVEQMQQARAAGVAQLEGQLPADVLDALKARAAELRKQEKLLVGERLKVATSAR